MGRISESESAFTDALVLVAGYQSRSASRMSNSRNHADWMLLVLQQETYLISEDSVHLYPMFSLILFDTGRLCPEEVTNHEDDYVFGQSPDRSPCRRVTDNVSKIAKRR
jgi:hypothetical protein